MSLTDAGLALDIIGAFFLSAALFRGPRMLYPGHLRSPEDVGQDRAVAVVGFLFLLAGFLGQLLGSAGLGDSSRSVTLLSALVAFGGGAPAAFGVWVALRRWPRLRGDRL